MDVKRLVDRRVPYLLYTRGVPLLDDISIRSRRTAQKGVVALVRDTEYCFGKSVTTAALHHISSLSALPIDAARKALSTAKRSMTS
jgi:hypothetical protein